MGNKGLRKLQLGDETAEGTAVAASALWRGEAAGLQDDQNLVFVEEDVGYLPGTDRTYIDRLSGTYNMPVAPLTFQQLPYILSAGIENIIAGVQDGAGTGYLHPTIRYFDKSAYLVEMTAVFEHDSEGVARKTAWRAETPNLVRVRCVGPALGTPSAYTTEIFQLDCAAKVASV